MRTWVFDLDNTLHDADPHIFPHINRSMTEYLQRELGLDEAAAGELRRHYWLRYGATLSGLQRHHGVKPAHFLSETHRLPGLDAELHGHAHDKAAQTALQCARKPFHRRLYGGGGRSLHRKRLAVLLQPLNDIRLLANEVAVLAGEVHVMHFLNGPAGRLAGILGHLIGVPAGGVP